MIERSNFSAARTLAYRTLAFGLFVLLLSPFGFGESSSFAQTTNQTREALRDSFSVHVQSEIARHFNGQYLYGHSDAFENEVNQKVLRDLGVTSADLAPEETTQTGTKESYEPLGLQSFTRDASKSAAAQNETTVAISRKNHSLIVAAANDENMFNSSMPAYVSTDAGSSWNTYQLPFLNLPSYRSGGDPIVVAASDGTLYYALLIYNQQFTFSNLLIARSTNGRSWTYGNPVLPSQPSADFEDKETIVIDQDSTSPYFGRLYIAWMHYIGRDSVSESPGLKLAWSDDQGDTWSDPIQLTFDESDFSQLATGRHGAIYLSYSEQTDLQDLGGTQVVLSSVDGGVSFARHVVAQYTTYPQYPRKSHPMLKDSTGFRSYPYMSIAADPASDRLFTVHGSYDNSVAALYYSFSSDQGVTWQAPIALTMLSDAAPADRFHPWVTYDPVTSKAFATFYSSEPDTANILAGIMRVELEGSMPRNYTRLDTALFDPSLCYWSGSPFIGDYMGSDAFGGTYAAVWTENRPGFTDGEVYAYVSSTTAGVERRLLPPNSLTFYPPSQNPITSSSTELYFGLPSSGEAIATLTDDRGITLTEIAKGNYASGKHQIHLDCSKLASGTYFCRVTSGGETATQKLVVVR
jgi:hypothetical protein